MESHVKAPCSILCYIVNAFGVSIPQIGYLYDRTRDVAQETDAAQLPQHEKSEDEVHCIETNYNLCICWCV